MAARTRGYQRHVTRDRFRDQSPAEPDLLAVAEDLPAARVAIEALQSAGIDGAHIELLGRAAEEARDRGETAGPDGRLFGHVSHRVVRGAVVGALIGAGVGAVIGVVAMLLLAGSDLGAFIIGVVVGALLGSWVGPFLALERKVGYSPDWELTFADVPDDSACVAVWTPSPELHGKAAAALEGVERVEVRSG